MKNVTRGVRLNALGVVLAIALLIGIPGVTDLRVQAEDNDYVETLEVEVLENVQAVQGNAQRTMLNNCIISVHNSEAGMHVEFTTGCVGTASVIGVKDIVIMKKVWYGWKTVVTSAGAESYNKGIFGKSHKILPSMHSFSGKYCKMCFTKKK